MTRARYAAGMVLALGAWPPCWADEMIDTMPPETAGTANAQAGAALCAPVPAPVWLSANAPSAEAWPAILLPAPTSGVTSLSATPPPEPRDSSSSLPSMEVAAATLAGLGVVGALGWRLGRMPALPWHTPSAEPAFALAGDDPDDDRDAEGWRLSRFDDLPGAEPVKPLRPLYDSLDDVIDVVPLTTRRR